MDLEKNIKNAVGQNTDENFMIYFPTILFLIFLFIISLPAIFVFLYFKIITLGFENLGFSPALTLFLLFLMLIGSFFNLPLTKKRIILKKKSYFFNLFNIPFFEIEGIAINFGGGVIPILLSLYFLFSLWKMKFPLEPVILATLLMILLCFCLARVIPKKGICLPVFVPPFFSAVFALLFAPQYPAPTAFIAGVLGTLIGADILHLKEIQKYGGYLSIGGAGVFDGIFLVGIISALLAGK